MEARIFKSKSGSTMPYRILNPADYDPKKTYPLVFCLHGTGGRKTDNKSIGTEAFVALSAAKTQSEYPAFLLTPQCPSEKQRVNTSWCKGSYSISKIPISKELELVVQILDAVGKEFSIDSLRIYVTGQSMGGYGDKDTTVPTKGSREMIEAFKQAGSKIKYTEYKGAGQLQCPGKGL